MELLTYEYWGSVYKIPSFSYHTLIVGTGAAGFNAADSLYNLGVTDIAILTEGVNMGTSRNTGSDKQTYYKLSLDGGFTCPNIDGRCGVGGCIYCSSRGSGDFAESPSLPLGEQYESLRKKLSSKWDTDHCIAYFQAHTNTYAPIDFLKKNFEEQ